MKCSAISLQNKDALEVATALYKDCFDYAQKTSQVDLQKKINNGTTIAF